MRRPIVAVLILVVATSLAACAFAALAATAGEVERLMVLRSVLVKK